MTTSEWGRVADDGTVYVRTAEGERAVGQYPEGSAEEALAFYAKRYEEMQDWQPPAKLPRCGSVWQSVQVENDNPTYFGLPSAPGRWHFWQDTSRCSPASG